VKKNVHWKGYPVKAEKRLTYNSLRELKVHPNPPQRTLRKRKPVLHNLDLEKKKTPDVVAHQLSAAGGSSYFGTYNANLPKTPKEKGTNHENSKSGQSGTRRPALRIRAKKSRDNPHEKHTTAQGSRVPLSGVYSFMEK